MIDFNIDNYLRISWQDVLLVCISSLIIVVVCKHFFWNKLLAYIAKRQQIIQDNIDSSEKLKAQAEETKAEYDKKMQNAGMEANEIVNSARQEAEQQKEQILSSARQQADNIERSAREEIERDKLKAQKEMKNAITEVAIAAAGQILEKEVDADKQKEIVDQVIDSTGNGKW